MLEQAQSLAEKEVAVESREIALNFDSRIARDLVVRVRALDEPKHPDRGERRVSVSIAAEQAKELADSILEDVAKSEIRSLERKKRTFPDSHILVNHLASLYTLIGDHRAAVTIVNEGLTQSNSDVLRNKLATILINLKKYTEADDVLNTLMVSEWQLPSLISRAYIRVRQGDIESAKRFVDDALRVDYFDYSACLFAGAINIWGGEYIDAIRSFKTASEERPKSSIPLVHMAAAYFGLGQSKKALDTLRRATQLNPLDDRAVTFYCDLLFRVGRSDLAIRPLERLYGLWGEKTNGDVLDRLARAYVDCTQHVKALQLIQRRLSQSPKNASLLNNAGVVLWRRGKTDDAKTFLIEASERVVSSSHELTLDKAIPLTNLLTLLVSVEEYSLAVDYARRFISKLSGSSDVELKVDVLARYAEGLAGLRKKEEAASVIETALPKLDIKEPAIFKLISFLLHHYSVVFPNKERVRQLSKEALVAVTRGDIDEKLRVHCINNAAFSLLFFDDVRQASDYLRHIAKYALKNPYVTATFGLYYFRKGNIGRGKELYERAAALTTDRKLKARIRQRMALELAKEYHRHNEEKDALYWVERAIREKEGFYFARAEAVQLKETLQRKLRQ